MGDPDFWVRINAGGSLTSHGDAAAEAIPPIIRLLRTEDRNLRGQAAEVLGKFGPSARVATAALLVALDEEKDHVRKSAEGALNAVSPIESETADEALEALRQASSASPAKPVSVSSDLGGGKLLPMSRLGVADRLVSAPHDVGLSSQQPVHIL
jgi:HEAT repeat protein